MVKRVTWTINSLEKLYCEHSKYFQLSDAIPSPKPTFFDFFDQNVVQTSLFHPLPFPFHLKNSKFWARPFTCLCVIMSVYNLFLK